MGSRVAGGKPSGHYVDRIVKLLEENYCAGDFTRDALPDKPDILKGLQRVVEIYNACDSSFIQYGTTHMDGRTITGCVGEPLGVHALRDMLVALGCIPSACYKLGGVQEFFVWLEGAHSKKPTQPPEWRVLRTQLNSCCIDSKEAATFGNGVERPPRTSSHNRGRSSLRRRSPN